MRRHFWSILKLDHESDNAENWLGSCGGRFHLRELIPQLDSRFRYVVEVRGRSWFQDLAYNFFADNNIRVGRGLYSIGFH